MMEDCDTSFLDRPAPNFGPNLIKEIQERHPSVFLICFRDKNHNVVVYETRKDKNNKLLDPPVIGYWLVIEDGEGYRPMRRSQGIQHDREEFSYFDVKYAYGFSAIKLSDEEAEFSFNMKQYPLRIKVGKNIKDCDKLFATKDNQTHYIRSISVSSSDQINILNLEANVKYLYLQTLNITQKPFKAGRVFLIGNESLLPKEEIQK